jgi:hypothetical protein
MCSSIGGRHLLSRIGAAGIEKRTRCTRCGCGCAACAGVSTSLSGVWAYGLMTCRIPDPPLSLVLGVSRLSLPRITTRVVK